MNTEIQNQINRISSNITNAFTAVGNKGGTVPSSKVIANLPSAIDTIRTSPGVWNGEYTNLYMISISAGTGGSASGGGGYESGQSCTVTASPSSYYRFDKWTESGTSVSTSASYNFTVSKSRTLKANFISVATVTTSGTGNSSYCYATINGSKITSAGTYNVDGGSTITFGVYGYSSSYYGEVKIDGTQLLKVTDKTTQTYTWTVPNTIKSATVSFSYTSTSTRRNGKITVTTTAR